MRLKRFVGLALTIATIATASGCASGFSAHTNSQKPSGNGRFASADALEIRGATIVADPKDPSKGMLLVTIYNSGESDEYFTDINNPPAESDPIKDKMYGDIDRDVQWPTHSKILLEAGQRTPIGIGSAAKVQLSSTNRALIPGKYVAINLNFKTSVHADMKLLVNANTGIYAGVKIS